MEVHAELTHPHLPGVLGPAGVARAGNAIFTVGIDPAHSAAVVAVADDAAAFIGGVPCANAPRAPYDPESVHCHRNPIPVGVSCGIIQYNMTVIMAPITQSILSLPGERIAVPIKVDRAKSSRHSLKHRVLDFSNGIGCTSHRSNPRIIGRPLNLDWAQFR